MDQQTLKKLLPCYLCGDLPPGVAEQVRAALAADAELRALLEGLSVSRSDCAAVVSELAGEVPWIFLSFETLDPTEATVPPELMQRFQRPAPSAGRWGLWVGLAVAAAVALFFGLGSPAPAEIELLAVHAVAIAQPATFIAESDPVALGQALVRAGVEPSLAMPTDLSAEGMALVGGMPAPDGRVGAVIVYEKDGVRYVCQMYPSTLRGSTPDRTLEVAGVQLRAFEAGDTSVVTWRQNGMVCLFSGPLPVDALLAVISARVVAAG